MRTNFDKTPTPSTPTTHGSAKVFNRLREQIIDKQYRYNERLPPERMLARQFDVARGTVRSALQQLEKSNMVVLKFGVGAFSIYNPYFDQEEIAEQTSPLELIEARLAIETHVVKLVVTHASHRDLKKLVAALNHVLSCTTDANEFSIADEGFHLTLAQCSQNPLIIWMYQKINNIRTHSQWSQQKKNILSVEKIKKYNEQHADLLQWIMKRDVKAAEQSIIDHLKQAKKDLSGY